MRLTPEQCRAGRALLNWSQIDLARRAKVAQKTIAVFELATRSPRRSTLGRLAAALTKAGVLLIDPNGDGPGVRLKKRK